MRENINWFKNYSIGQYIREYIEMDTNKKNSRSENNDDLKTQLKSLIDIANENGLTKASDFLKQLTDEENF